MIEMFRLNGEIYCKLFAWTPVRTSNADQREWIWLDHYYLRMASHGRAAIIMNKEEFRSDYNRRS